MAAEGSDLIVSTPYTQSLPYSDKRHFESPRIHVPPPILDYQDGKPTFNVSADSFEQRTPEYGNPAFVNSLRSCQSLQMTHSMLTWRYEMRRAAQPVLPYIFLGPSSAARDRDFLSDSGITLMVAVRSIKAVKARPAFLNPANFVSKSGVPTLSFDFDSTYDFVSKARDIIKGINDHLEQTCAIVPVEDMTNIGGKVLVFCESGNDRSPVLVAAYLMVVHGVDAFAAIHIIQSQRFCITMSDEMKNVLVDLQHILQAQRTVSASTSGLNPQHDSSEHVFHSPKFPKRQSDDMDTSDNESITDPTRPQTFIIREGVAPFTDTGE